MQERITAASLHLLFFTLELNRIDDAVLDAAMRDPRARPLPAVDRGCAQGKAVPARGPRRAAVPREVGDRRCAPGTGCSTRRSRRCASRSAARSSRIEPTLNLMQDTDGKKRKAASRGARRRPSRRTCAPSRSITNTLAKDKEISDRWRGFEDVADARHLSNRVEPEVVEALVAAVRDAYPRLSHRYYALKAKWFGKKRLPHWDRNAPLPKVDTRTDRLGRGAGHGADRLRRVLAAAWPTIAERLLRRATGSTRRCGPASSPAPSRIRPCRRRIPMCCSTIRASRAT